MNCPFCGGTMQHGEIISDARTRIRWIPENRFNKTTMEKLFSEVLHITGVRRSGGGYNWIQADYCTGCKKMIFETDIERE